MAFSNVSNLNYCAPLLPWGIDSRTRGGYEKPSILYTQVPRWALCIQDSAPTDSSKGGESGTVFTEKKSEYEWTPAVQTCVVQGSIEIEFSQP